MIGRGLFLSLFGEIHVRLEGFSFYGHRKSNEEADRSDKIFAVLIILHFRIHALEYFSTDSHVIRIQADLNQCICGLGTKI